MPEPSTKQSKDSPTRAPESGEPTDRAATGTKSPASSGRHSEKSKPGNPKLGEDLESGRADAKP